MSASAIHPSLSLFLACPHWQDKYRLLMSWGTLDTLDSSEKVAAHQLAQCTAHTWLLLRTQDPCRFGFFSESKLINGLGHMFLNELQAKSREEILSMNMSAFSTHADLQKHLSPSRSNGVLNILLQAQNLCRQG